MMLDDASSMSSDSVSRQARRAAAAPTEQFVAGGIQLVVEGRLLDAGRPRAVVAGSRWCNLLASASRPACTNWCGLVQTYPRPRSWRPISAARGLIVTGCS